jgi:hypothetical protein
MAEGLADAGIPVPPSDGGLSPNFREALTEYQAALSLPESGILDRHTQASLGVRCEVVGLHRSRARVLHDHWELRPSVADLVAMDYSAFHLLQGERYLERHAVRYATARFFALYLQEKGVLRSVYFALRDRADTPVSPEASTSVLEGLLGKTIDEIDEDFGEWFRLLPD